VNAKLCAVTAAAEEHHARASICAMSSDEAANTLIPSNPKLKARNDDEYDGEHAVE
jgi:hypothetical protein